MNADKRSKGLTDIPEKLLKIAADIAERGNANLTRLLAARLKSAPGPTWNMCAGIAGCPRLDV
jgi:hypothetical protein